MANWVRIDAQQFNPPESIEGSGGVRFNVRMSPHDIPHRVCGSYLEDKEHFVIEFQYMSEEPYREQRIDDHITLRVGKHSGRLYRIEIDVKALKAETVDLNVSVEVADKIQALKSSRPERVKNYGAAKRAVLENQNELFESLGT